MIECHESDCPYHLNTEPYCGEAECMRHTVNISEDGIELDMTEYDLRGITSFERCAIQLEFNWDTK